MTQKNEIDVTLQKWCNKCNRFRPKTRFFTDNSKSDNLKSECMTCTKKTSRVAYRKVRAGLVDFKNMTAFEYAEHRRQDMREARVSAKKWVLRKQQRFLRDLLQELTS